MLIEEWKAQCTGKADGESPGTPVIPLLLLAVTSSAASSDTRLSLGIPYRPLAFLLLSGPAFRLSFLPGDPGGQLWRKPGEAESHESSPHFSRHRKGCRYMGSGVQESRPYLGMSKFILGVVNINRAQELLRGLLAVDELSLWYGTCV